MAYRNSQLASTNGSSNPEPCVSALFLTDTDGRGRRYKMVRTGVGVMHAHLADTMKETSWATEASTATEQTWEASHVFA